jgi:3-dehydroquinate dehydratase-2
MAEPLVLIAPHPKPLAADIRCAEIPLGTVFGRAAYCHTGFFGNVARGRLCGCGADGYELAVQAACRRIAASGDH